MKTNTCCRHMQILLRGDMVALCTVACKYSKARSETDLGLVRHALNLCDPGTQDLISRKKALSSGRQRCYAMGMPVSVWKGLDKWLKTRSLLGENPFVQP